MLGHAIVLLLFDHRHVIVLFREKNMTIILEIRDLLPLSHLSLQSFFSVGSPLELPKIPNPTTEEVDRYHEKFMTHLIKHFETQKHKYLKDGNIATLEFL